MKKFFILKKGFSQVERFKSFYGLNKALKGFSWHHKSHPAAGIDDYGEIRDDVATNWAQKVPRDFLQWIPKHKFLTYHYSKSARDVQ